MTSSNELCRNPYCECPIGNCKEGKRHPADAPTSEVIYTGDLDVIAKFNGTAAQEALQLIYKDRRAEYNDPADEFRAIAQVWTQILPCTEQITPYQYALCMIAVKLVREAGNHKRDNIVDMIGYAQILDDLRGRV